MRSYLRILAVVLFFGLMAALSPAPAHAEGGQLTPKELTELSKVRATIDRI